MTDEQKAIIEAPSGARLIVLAAAGTGKTEVVARRLAWLTRNEDLLPGRDFLVLSFSRAAVGEVRRRLRRIDPSLASLRVATLDSFATRLLAAYAPDDEWAAAGFDARIRAATDLITLSPEALELLAGYRHVIVDEVQDLVGDRARFVGTILEALAVPAGFTVLGDPAQGIYDFQLAESKTTLTSAELLRELTDLSPHPERLALSHDHRATSPEAGRAAQHGALIREAELSGVSPSIDVRRLIEDDLYRLPRYDCSTAGRLLERRSTQESLTGAVLCRFNSQALVVSRAFAEIGVQHRLQQAADDPVVAPWVGRVFCGFPFAAMSRRQFQRSLNDLDVSHPEADVSWRALMRLDGRQHEGLSVALVRAALGTRRLGDELEGVPASDIVVSSVHRAKGLEWDVVILCGLEEAVDDPFSDARLLYVAMTRTRDELYALEQPDTLGMKSQDQTDGRWVRRSPDRRRLLELELLASDVHTLDPAGEYMIDDDARGLQAYLATAVEPGDEVQLELLRSSVDGQPRAVYRIDHRGRALGVTSDALASALWNNLAVDGSLERGFPRVLAGGRVYAVETVGGSTSAGRGAGLGSSGLWLAPRLHGLTQVCWEEPT